MDGAVFVGGCGCRMSYCRDTLRFVGFLRFESDQPDGDGFRVGVFGLANVLARSGRLTPEDWAFWRSSNDWYNGAYADPGSVDPSLWDKEVNPVVECWFKESAGHLLDRVPGYLDLLARNGIRCVERRSTDPGTILYEDDVQVVVRPHPARTCIRYPGTGLP